MISQIGLSKSNIVKPKFHHKYTAKHQKTSRVPINLQPRATDELNRLQKGGQIEKLTSALTKNHFSNHDYRKERSFKRTTKCLTYKC